MNHRFFCMLQHEGDCVLQLTQLVSQYLSLRAEIFNQPHSGHSSSQHHPCGTVCLKASDLLAQSWSSRQLSKLTSSQSSFLHCLPCIIFACCSLFAIMRCDHFGMALYKSLCIFFFFYSRLHGSKEHFGSSYNHVKIQ